MESHGRAGKSKGLSGLDWLVAAGVWVALAGLVQAPVIPLVLFGLLAVALVKQWLDLGLEGGPMVCLLLVLGGVATCVPVERRYSSYACGICGLATSWSGPPGREVCQVKVTELRLWYERRIGEPHEHRWVHGVFHTVHNLYGLKIMDVMGTRYGEPFYDSEIPARALRRLEPLGLDRAFYRDLTHLDPDHRHEASKIAGSIIACNTGPHLLEWWARAQTHLDDRAAWNRPFEFRGLIWQDD